MPSGERAICGFPIERSSESEVTVKISDSGCGIAQENLKTIFEPFFTTKEDRGTGIGLWVVKRIVEKLRGRIDLISVTTGKTGTCFGIVLPTAAVAAVHPESKQESA